MLEAIASPQASSGLSKGNSAPVCPLKWADAQVLCNGFAFARAGVPLTAGISAAGAGSRVQHRPPDGALIQAFVSLEKLNGVGVGQRAWSRSGPPGTGSTSPSSGARFAWYAAVTSIVVGHIAAVYLADVRAHSGARGTRAAALRSQVPLTALMVVYTFVSLSILSEPIVERRAPAQPIGGGAEMLSIPEDALLPAARHRSVAAGRTPAAPRD